jgi:hypothetical protein
MTNVISAVNFIRSCRLNHRHFKALLDRIESEYGDAVYYREVFWLSEGKVLQCLLSLLQEIIASLTKKGLPVILKMQVGYVI